MYSLNMISLQSAIDLNKPNKFISIVGLIIIIISIFKNLESFLYLGMLIFAIGFIWWVIEYGDEKRKKDNWEPRIG